MTDKPWWITAIQWTVWFLVVSAVMGWLARTRLKERSLQETSMLKHPVSTLIIGVICFAFFAGIAVLSNVFRNKTTTWWTTAIFVGFALMSVPLILDYFLARHRFSMDGLHYSKWHGGQRHFRWTDLQSVRYSPGMKWFVLKTTRGETARISTMLMGLPEFARQLLERAPADIIDEFTLGILHDTANGSPPSLWA